MGKDGLDLGLNMFLYSENCELLTLPIITVLLLVGIVTGYRLDCLGSIPSRDKFFLFYMVPRTALGSTQPPIELVPGAVSGWGVKRQRCEAD
jgi:hypothetical protein